jgi:uncharacterized membrane protein YfhO
MANNKQTAATPSGGFNLLDFINNYTRLMLFLLMGLICLVVFNDFIFFKKIYLFKDIGSDSINMYIPWFNCYADYVKEVGTPGWSFQQGMGQNIFPLWLGDFFSNIMMYFDKSAIPYALAYMEIAKILLAGFAFYLFLKELKLSNFVSLVFALLYAFSGFMIMGGSWVIYSIEALNIAVILYGFERWLNHKKYFWFVVGIMLLTVLQPSLLFPYSIFLGCYISARYFDLNEKGGKAFWIFAAKTVALAALGVGLSAYQLLPDILQIIESPRVGGESAFFEKLQKQSMFSVADEMLRFTTVFRSFGTDMLGNGNNYRGWYNYLEAPIFYCGLLCLVIIPHFFMSLTVRQKRIYGLITFLFFVPLILPYFRYVFWAFSGDYFRTFSLVIVLLLVIFSARAMNYLEQQPKVNKVTLVVTVLFLLFLLYTPSARYKSSINVTMRTMATALILGYGFIIYRMGELKASAKNLKPLFLFICVIELMYFSYGTVNNRDVLRAGMLKEKIGYNDYTLEAVNFLKRIDKDFYRINKDYTSGLAMHASVNDAKAQGYYGTGSYHSFNQKNYIKFLGDFGVINVKEEFATRWAPGVGNRPLLFSLCAGKYWLTKSPVNTMSQFGYDSIAQFGDVKVLRNRFSTPLGFAYNKIISEDDLKKLSSIQKDIAISKACVIENKDYPLVEGFKKFDLADSSAMITFEIFGANVNALKQDNFAMSSFSENKISGTIQVNEAKILFFSFPYDEGWRAKINNNDAALLRVNAGLTGLLLKPGINAVELAFEPRLKKQGALLSTASLLLLGGLLGFARFRKKKLA